jgi:CRP/FNR family transcriptional regulator, cyclic AMP receptor protein
MQESIVADPSLQSYIAHHPMFEGLSVPQVELMASHAFTITARPQERIFKHDTPADRFYIVRDGKVALQVPAIEGEPLTIQTVGAGNVLGWSWLVAPYLWLFDARALVPSVLVAFDGGRLREQCDADPELGYALLRHFARLMAERLNAARLAAISQHLGG